MNNTTSFSNQTEDPTHAARWRPAASSLYCVGYISSFAIIAIVILCGNITTLVIFSQTKALRKKAHFLLMNLCVVDFFMGVYAAFFCSGFIFQCRIFDAKYFSLDAKEAMQWFFFVPFFTALYTITAISIERVVAVHWPYYYRSAGNGMFVALVIFPWIFAVANTLIYLVLHKVIKATDIGTHMLWITALICLVITVISYIAVFIKVFKNIFKSGGTHSHEALRDKRIAVTVLLVTVASVLAWSPSIILQPVIVFCPECLVTFSNDYWYILQLWVFANSAINIIIYAGRMPVFRKALVSLLCKGKLLRRISATNGGNHSKESREHVKTNETPI